MTCHRRSRRRACLPCASSGDSSGYHTEREPGHTGGRDKVSPRCGFSCESSSCLTGKRTFYTWSRSKESCHCGFFGVSSSYWSGRQICHKLCRGRAVPQNGSDGVTLSLKSKKTTSYIFCRHKAPLLCGSSRAFASYCFGRMTLYSWGSPGQFAIFFAADTDFEDLAGTCMAGQFEVQPFQVLSYFVAKSVAEIVAQAVEDLELGLQ